MRRKLTLTNTVGGQPTRKFATFKKLTLVLSKRAVYSERQMSFLVISVKIYKLNIKNCYKTNLKFFQYNVGRPTCTVATFQKFRLVLFEPDIYSESAQSVLVKSEKNYKKKSCSFYKTNLKYIPYNVIGLWVNMPLFQYSATI